MDTQFKHGIVELLVMKTLQKGPMTSHEVIHALSDALDVTANTIYPILRRLNEKGYVRVEKLPSKIGPPKKLYRLSAAGETRLESLETEWKAFISKAFTILGGTPDA
ncbi:MAG: PadR family transcriptional regulator [Bacillota bacterium]